MLFGVLCLPGDQSHPFAQPTINPLERCICWARLLGRAVFPPWNEGPNFGSYNLLSFILDMEFSTEFLPMPSDNYSVRLVTSSILHFLLLFVQCTPIFRARSRFFFYVKPSHKTPSRSNLFPLFFFFFFFKW